MELIIPSLKIVIGLLILAIGGDLIVRGAVKLAFLIKVSELAIGIIVVASGTSMPEFFVSLNAIFKGSSDLSVGNIVGSNIANILLVIGLISLVKEIILPKKILLRDGFYLLFTTIIFVIFSLFGKIGFFFLID